MVANLTLPQPAAVGDEWGNALNAGVQAVNADVETQKGRLISTGLGLLGGGSLAANRSLSIDFAASGASSATKAVRADDSRLSDARPLAGVIPDGGLPNRLRTNPITYQTTFDGLLANGWYAIAPPATNGPPGSTTGGYWQLRVDAYEAATVTQTAWDAGVSGVAYRRTYGGSPGTWTAWTKLNLSEAVQDARYAPLGRTITAGSGLTGGGNLTSDRTLALDWPAAATEVARSPGAPSLGVSAKPARIDHVHPVPNVETTNTANQAGWSSSCITRRRGGIVSLYINAGRTTAWGGGALVCNIPAGHRPLDTVYFNGVGLNSGTTYSLLVDTVGAVKTVLGNDGSVGGFFGFLTYVCDQL